MIAGNGINVVNRRCVLFLTFSIEFRSQVP